MKMFEPVKNNLVFISETRIFPVKIRGCSVFEVNNYIIVLNTAFKIFKQYKNERSISWLDIITIN